MRLTKTINRRGKNKTYYKFQMSFPKSLVEKADFENKELRVILRRGKIVVEKA
jgi:hypothetical protein